MSKIVIIAETIANPAKFISHVRRATGMSISDIRSRIEKRVPLVEWTMFMNDHDDVAQRLRDLATIEEDGEGTLGIFELMPDEDFSTCPRDICQITVDVLRNILNSHDELPRRMG